MTPGVFQSSGDGRRVFFVERESSDAVNARNVFILMRPEAGESVTTAKTGRLEADGDDRYLVLERGQRNEINLKNGERTLSSFESYRVLASERRGALGREAGPPRTMRTIDLMRQPTARNQGELVWRFGLLLAAANLLLLGIGLAATNPRRASNWNLLFALLSFVIYYNLVNLSQSGSPAAASSMGLALLGLHGGVLCPRAGAALVARPRRGHGFRPSAGTEGDGMKTVRRLLYRDISASVMFVALAFLSLFYFIDFVDELDNVGDNGALAGGARCRRWKCPGTSTSCSRSPC